jgi:rubrerythrin
MDDILKKNEQVPENTTVTEFTKHVEKEVNSGDNNGIDIGSEVAPEDLDSRWLRWKCLVCGYLYEGVTRLKVCPKCGNQDPDKFEDAE